MLDSDACADIQRRRLPEPLAVIHNLQYDFLSLLNEAHLSFGRTRVAEHIGESLLDNSIQRNFEFCGESRKFLRQ